MKISDDSSAALFRAYQSPEAKLWDENIVNGEYIIAYELGSLHQDVQSMLPKVYFIFRTQKLFIVQFFKFSQDTGSYIEKIFRS